MLHRNRALLWTITNLKGRNINQITGQNIPMLNRNQRLKDSALTKSRGATVGQGMPGSARKNMSLARSFMGHTVSDVTSAVLPTSTTHEFKLKVSLLDLPIQHLIVSIQRQIDANGRREVPQRTIWAHAELTSTKDNHFKAANPARTYVEPQKPIDVGYTYSHAEAFTPHRDEAFHRIKKHFERKGVVVRFDRFYEDPPGLSLQLKWYAEDDARVLTPEGEPVATPRVDVAQPFMPAMKGLTGIGHGLHMTAA
eukprot:TRINITY_DN25881_c0_g1_i1.p1 TRINITY_DN25881_c0_g1~~TRINITY_DN25881_c0_g1_i1.p1  ORF type:complete len:253 (+),score=66.60 TRINITY_DN25881_c0_g1_i1:81-839(+)